MHIVILILDISSSCNMKRMSHWPPQRLLQSKSPALLKLTRSRVGIFLIRRILVKTMSRTLHGLSTKSFIGSLKYRYEFFNGSRNMFLNLSERNQFIIFLIMLPKLAQGTWLKFSKNIEIKSPFHLKAHFHVLAHFMLVT